MPRKFYFQTPLILGGITPYNYNYSVFFDDVANINFATDTPQNADILIGQADGVVFPDDTTGGYSYKYDPDTQSPDYQPIEKKYGDIWFNEDFIGWDSGEKGSADFWNVLHELGHAVGLDGDDDLPSGINNQKYTMMSYNLLPGMDSGNIADRVYASGLQLLDIAAVQEIYGRNYSTRSGDTTYSKMTAFASTRPNDAFIYTIWDGNGADEVNVSAYTNPQGAIIDLRQGEFSSVGYNALGGAAVDNLAIAYYAIIEDATGTANADILIGNAWDNILVGGAGDDRIFGDGASVALDLLVSQIKNSDDGFGSIPAEHEAGSGVAAALDGSGNDTLIGGTGNDILYGGAGNDTYVYNLGDGNDIYREAVWNGNIFEFGGIASSDITISESGNDLIYNISGGGQVTFEDYLDYSGTTTNTVSFLSGGSGTLKTGDSNNNILYGTTGNDVIYGGGGNDFIDDDWGNDSLNGGTGIDTINSSGIGNKIISGGSDDDAITYSYYSPSSANNLSWTATIDAGSGNDIVKVVYSGIVNTEGGTGDDELWVQPGFGAPNSLNEVYATDISGDDLYWLWPQATEITDYAGNDTYIILNGGSVSGSSQIDDRQGISDVIQYASKFQDDGSGLGFKQELEYANQVGNDLEFGVKYIKLTNGSAGITHAVTLKDYYAGNEVEYIQFSDTGLIDLEEYLFSNTIAGTSGDDVLNGTSADDSIYGFAGDDILDGVAGDDRLLGGAGNDIFKYNSGLDTFEDSGDDDTIQFGSGISVYDLTIADSGADDTLITLNAGTDEILLQDNLNANTNLRFENLEFDNGLVLDFTDYANWQWGTSAFESIVGDGNDNTILGGAGNDNLKGKAGNDQIDGGDGNDKIWGGAGDDYIFGGLGLDTLRGEAGNDTLVGASDNDTLYGGTGNDILDGGIGSGFDNLLGEAGDDILYATAGNDFLRGGTGSDRFVFDDITDFAGTAAATIKSGFDSNATGDNDVLDIKDIIDYDSSTDVLSDFVALTDNSTNTTVSVDKDGTGTAFGWTTVAIIQGAAGEWIDADDMLAQDNLIAA